MHAMMGHGPRKMERVSYWSVHHHLMSGTNRNVVEHPPGED